MKTVTVTCFQLNTYFYFSTFSHTLEFRVEVKGKIFERANREV